MNSLAATTIKTPPRLASTSPGMIWLVPLLCLTLCSVALGQVAQPTATPADTATPQPTASPTPDPAATPQPTPDYSDPAVIAAYNATRTPQVSVTVATAASGSTSGVSSTSVGRLAATRTAASTVQPIVKHGVGTLVRLPPPALARSKISSTSATTSASANAQPVATVSLTYDPSYVGQLVWVQMLSVGTLTAYDSDGHAYDGSNGFLLTLDATGTATFNYQTSNASGTYQVLTRFSNVTTTLPFLVPDAAP